VGDGVAARLQALTTGGADTAWVAQNVRIFYRRRAHQPAWMGPAGPLGHADALLGALAGATDHGLDPERYARGDLARRVADMRAARRASAAGAPAVRVAPASAAELDVALTGAFLNYADDLHRGLVRPGEVGEAWPLSGRADLAGVLQTGLDLQDPRRSLEQLAPPQAEYRRLQAALRQYRFAVAAGGWPPCPRGPLARGERGARVDSLVRRLVATGDLSPGAEAVLAGEVSRALASFQRRHGLASTGWLDEATRRALQVPASQRARQLEAALERWRWLPHDLGSRYVLVRLADFELDVVVGGRRAATHRVAVGAPYRRTPVFGSRIERLIVNPSWRVPERIAREEVLPLLLADRSAAARLGYGVAARGATGGSGPDWEELAASDEPLRLVQAPGPANALGKLKLEFPNAHQVYLHDTPNRAVFETPDRGVSHGCVRVEDARALAERLLALDGEAGRARLDEAWASAATQVLTLHRPVPVYVLYWTARAAADGEVHFSPDLYGGDRRLMALLGRR